MEFYKANKANKGCGGSFSYDSSLEKNLFCGFLNLIQQNGWNPKGNSGKGAGIFKGGKETTIKLSSAELGLIAACIRKTKNLQDLNMGRTIYHEFSSGSVKTVHSIDLSAWVDATNKRLNGFTFTVNKTVSENSENVTFRLALTVGEAEELRVWMEEALASIARGRKSKKIKAYQAKQKENQGSKEPSSKDGGEEIPF